MNKTIKRTNWTTEEVIELIEGCKLTRADGGEEDAWTKNYNHGVAGAADQFRSFAIPDDEFGALGYCTENKTIYHIGPIPPR